MKRVVLIDPEGIRHGLNIGLAYMSSSLAQQGHEVKVIDFNNNRYNQEARLEKEVKKADVIGLSIKTFTARESVRIAEKARRINKKAMIICGGPHIAADGAEFLTQNRVFDLGVVAEGEYILPEIAASKNLGNINGIIYRHDNMIIKTPVNKFIQDLDKLPFPDYDCFDLDKRKANFLLQAYPLLTSRGCPFRCIFCASWISMGRTWRARSTQNIIDELLRIKGKNKIVEFQIHDDNFTFDIDRAKDICQALITNKVDLRWSCPSGLKADKLDKELVFLMKQSGCYSVQLGIESGVEEIFTKINKGGTLNDIKRSVKMLKDAEIRVIGFFVIGLPASTFELDKRSINFAKNLNLDLAIWFMALPYKGTALYNILEKDRSTRILTDWRTTVHFGPEARAMFETAQYKAKDRLKMYYLSNLRSGAYVAFIKQNGSFFEKLFQVIKAILIGDPYHLFTHFLKAGLAFLKSVKRRREYKY